MAYPIATRGGRGSGNSSPYVPALGDLVLSGALVAGVASSGTILNATAGSAIASTVSGLTVSSAARTYTYNGSGAAGSTNNGLTETLAGATFSPRGNVVTIVSSAVPAFTSNPSISPQGGNVGGTFSGIDGAMSNGGSILSRRWLLNGTSIGSGTTVVPNAAGSLIFENTGTGNVVATSTAVTVAAVSPTLALSPTSPSVASNATAGTLVSNISNVPAGVTPTVTPNDGRLVIAGDSSAGWKVVVGMSALSAGTVNFSVAATGATGASGVLTVTAAGSGPTAFTYQTETSNLRSAMAATGTPISTARSRRWDRAVRVMKACGGWDAIGGLHLNAFDTEANFLKNLVSPGTYDLTKVGNPTFVANGDITHTASTDCYRSSATLLDLPQNDHGMGVFSNAAVTGNGIACGARDSGGKGVIIVPRGSANQALFQSQAAGNVTGTGTTGGSWTGNGWTGFSRDNSATIRTNHDSVTAHLALAQTSVAITEAVQLQVLGATGTTSVSSVGVQGFYWLKKAWTRTQERICVSILRDFLDSVRYGEPYIEEIGVGTATATYDAVFYGLSLMSICGARAARQNGLTACIVGDRQDATITSLGGMVGAGGLNWVDMTASNIAGQYREMCKWINVDYYGRADTNTQLNLSPDARAVNIACRRALDPSRTTGTGWVGMDIPVFMTGGAASVEKATDSRGGMKVTKLTTNDGRAFTAKFFSDGSYEGDLVPLIGAPFIFGREQAAASGLENKNGLRNQPAALLPPKNDTTGTTFKISPYVVAGDASSGLLPDMEPLPTGTGGSPDPANQSVNIRMMFSQSTGRFTNMFFDGAPRNYSRARYEAHARLLTAIVAAGETPSLNGMLTFNGTGTGTSFDFNAGPNGISSDLPGSGTRLMQALNSASGIRTIGDDIRDYNLGLVYFLRTDSSVPTAIQTAMKSYWFDSLYNLDPAPWGTLNFPDRHYQREPTWQMVSDNVLTGNDTSATDGTAPRISTKTIAMGNYREDQHDVRRVAYDDGTGMAIYRQGVNNGTVAGGSDGKNPIPYEIIVPPKSAATNVFIIGASSQTKLAWATNRMEPPLSLQGEAAGYAMFIANRDNVPVQDVDYATATTGLRAIMLSSAFIPSTTLPQVT
jgi:hypothetical protein